MKAPLLWVSANYVTIIDDSGQYSDALEWICRAIRLHDGDPNHSQKEGVYQSSTPLPHDIYASSNLSVSLTPLTPLSPFEDITPPRTTQLDAESIRERRDVPCCWVDMFVAATVAHLDLGSRVWGKGLEVSFDLMTQLGAVQNYCWVDDVSGTGEAAGKGGYILIGFFTALIPVARSPDGCSIQWHFEATGDHLANVHSLKSLQSEWLKMNDIKTLQTAKCFVGWCQSANILLGTNQISYNMGWTGLKQRSKSLHLKEIG